MLCLSGFELYPSEFLLSWDITVPENLFLPKFSVSKGSSLWDKRRLSFQAFASRGIVAGDREGQESSRIRSVGFFNTKPYKVWVKRLSEYLAYELSHRPDFWRGFIYIFIRWTFFHFPGSGLSVLFAVLFLMAWQSKHRRSFDADKRLGL